jgi:hypothetical protein
MGGEFKSVAPPDQGTLQALVTAVSAMNGNTVSKYLWLDREGLPYYRWGPAQCYVVKVGADECLEDEAAVPSVHPRERGREPITPHTTRSFSDACGDGPVNIGDRTECAE